MFQDASNQHQAACAGLTFPLAQTRGVCHAPQAVGRIGSYLVDGAGVIRPQKDCAGPAVNDDCCGSDVDRLASHAHPAQPHCPVPV